MFRKTSHKLRTHAAACARGVIALLVAGSYCNATARAAPASTSASRVGAPATLAQGVRVEPPPAWIASSELDQEALRSAQETASGRRYLLFDSQVRVGLAQTERYSHWVQQIVNESGLQSASQINIEFDPSYEMLVLHSVTVRRGDKRFDRLDRGEIRLVQREHNLEAQSYDGRQSAVLFISDLRVGDVVDYDFTTRGNDPTLGGKYVDTVLLGLPEPVAHLRSRILLPAARRLRVTLRGPGTATTDMDPEERQGRDFTEVLWERRGVAAYPIESDTPSGYDNLPYAQVSEFASWHDVAVWATRLFRTGVLSPTSPVRAWAQDHLREHPATEDFVLDAIRFVQDEVRYVAIEVGVGRRKPSDPALVLEHRYGDCKDKSALLVAILRAAGIDAEPALVSSTHGEVLGDFTPSPAVFDHVIVRVAPSNGVVYWVDSTTALQGGSLRRLGRSPFGMALRLNETTADLERLEPLRALEPWALVADEFAVAMPGSQEETRLTSVRTYRSQMADLTRAALRTLSSDAVTKHFLSLYEKDYPAIHATAPIEESDDRAKNVLRIVFYGGIPGFWTQEDKAEVLRSPASAGGMEQLFPSSPAAGRSAPLTIAFPLHAKYVSHFALPFALPASPEAVHVESALLDFHFDAVTADHSITYTYELLTRSSTVHPEQFDEHRTSIAKARKALFRELQYYPPLRNGPNLALIALFALCLPVLSWVAYRAYRYVPKRDPETVDPRIVASDSRIGGWLFLMAIGIALLPLRMAGGLYRDAKTAFGVATWTGLTTAGRPSYRPALAAWLVVEILVQTWFVAYTCTLAVLFFRKKRSFPGHFAIASLAIVAFDICDRVLVSVISPDSAHASVLPIVQTAIWAAVWNAYLRKSRRAALTFVR